MPAVVIDMGTATKLTALDAAGAVQGVSILPGMMVSLNALISGASQLSAVATQAPAHAIGKNTAESIQSGIVLGTADLLDGMLARFEAELGGPADVVATGGLAGLVVPHCRRSICRISLWYRCSYWPDHFIFYIIFLFKPFFFPPRFWLRLTTFRGCMSHLRPL